MNTTAQTTTTKATEHMLLIEETSKGILIRASDIMYIEADDNYCRLFLNDQQEILVCRSLRSYEEELSPNIFYRCHKSFLVNILYIKEYVTKNSECIIVLHGKKTVQVARRRVCELKRFVRIELGITLDENNAIK